MTQNSDCEIGLVRRRSDPLTDSKFTVSHVNERVLLETGESVSVYSAAEIKEVIDSCLVEYPNPRVILDIDSLRYLDMTAFAELLRSNKRIMQAGGDFQVVSSQPWFERALAVAAPGSLSVQSSLDDALAASELSELEQMASSGILTPNAVVRGLAGLSLG